MKEVNKDALEHAVINQLEADFEDQDYDSMSEMLQMLMKDDNNVEILINYLSDTAQENLTEGKTFKRY